MTATTPIRARLRAARDRQLVDGAVSADTSPERPKTTANPAKSSTLPYSWSLLERLNGLWTVVVRVTTTRQLLSVTHAARPDDDDCRRIAARLYEMRREEPTR